MALPTVSGVAVIAAEQLEKSAGPAAALAAFRPLVAKLGEGEARERAAVGAIRCAVRVGDMPAFHEIVPLWSTAHGDLLALAAELCATLAARGEAEAAARLAAEEADRQPGAHASYLLARCLEATGAPEAEVAYAEAIVHGEREGAADVVFHARARRVQRLAGEARTYADAIAEAARAGDDPAAPAAVRLVVAAARLAAPSRFARASALSTLEELSRSGSRPIADRAVRLAAEHADAMGEALTPVEAERLAAVLKQIRAPEEREAVTARFAALRRILTSPAEGREAALVAAAGHAPEIERPLLRARALLAGVREGTDLRFARDEDDASPGSLGLDAVAALRRGEPLAAESRLTRLADRVRPGAAAPAAVWTAARLGLGSPRRGVIAAAARLAAALLGAARGAPPRGFLALGLALRRRGHGAAAALAFQAALAAKEPAAARELGRERLLEGWARAQKGEREAAAAALREAKEALAKIA
jgi:hypothetical protein